MSAVPPIAWDVLLPFIATGLLAQLIDGTLGMGFGILSNGLLLLLGVPPLPAGMAVRTAESFTSGISGLSHALQGNVDWPLFARLAVPGVIGGILGAWILAHARADFARPVVLVYLAAVGLYLTWRAPRRPISHRRMRMVGPLALVGAAFDASGGGWGPVVAGGLLAQGATPRTAIGTVDAAEFFVTVTMLGAFLGTIGPGHFTTAAAGLLIGGAVAAPIGAFLVRRINPKQLVAAAGILMLAISLYGLLALIVGPIPNFARF